LDEGFPTVSELAVERSARKKERRSARAKRRRREGGKNESSRPVVGSKKGKRPDLPLVRMNPRVSKEIAPSSEVLLAVSVAADVRTRGVERSGGGGGSRRSRGGTPLSVFFFVSLGDELEVGFRTGKGKRISDGRGREKEEYREEGRLTGDEVGG